MQERSVYSKMTNAEKEVADYLKYLNVYWEHEQPVFVRDDRDRPRVWTPDFYLPELPIYIEVCGAERKESYDYRKKIYFKNSLDVAFVKTYEPKDRWKHYLKEYISKCSKKRFEKAENMIKKFNKDYYKFCPDCGNKLFDVGKFCQNCGYKFH